MQAEIARFLEIDAKTLRKFYRDQLDLGTMKANAAVARSLHKMATEGNVAAAIFWLKARAGWSERITHDVNVYDATADARLVRLKLLSEASRVVEDFLIEQSDGARASTPPL